MYKSAFHMIMNLCFISVHNMLLLSLAKTVSSESLINTLDFNAIYLVR